MKEEKKCEIIKDILENKGKSKYLNNSNNDSVYEIKTLINNYNDVKLYQIEKENKNQINNIFEQHNSLILANINSEAFELNTYIHNLKDIIYALIPLIEKDQLTTQDIYDNIVELVEKYIHYYVEFASSQVKLNLI